MAYAVRDVREDPRRSEPVEDELHGDGGEDANRQHYELAAQALAQADPGWLADVITRQVPLGQWEDAYAREPDDIKAILNFPDAP